MKVLEQIEEEGAMEENEALLFHTDKYNNVKYWAMKVMKLVLTNDY
jgi:hypothetical protein